MYRNARLMEGEELGLRFFLCIGVALLVAACVEPLQREGAEDLALPPRGPGDSRNVRLFPKKRTK